MEEQKLIQMIRFDHDLVVFIEGSDDQQRQVNVYGYTIPHTGRESDSCSRTGRTSLTRYGG